MLVAPNHAATRHTWKDGLPHTAPFKQYLTHFLILKVLRDSDSCGSELLISRREQCFSGNYLQLAKHGGKHQSTRSARVSSIASEWFLCGFLKCRDNSESPSLDKAQSPRSGTTEKNMKRIKRRHFLTNDLHWINYAWIMNHQWNNQGAAKNGVLQDWCSRYNVTCSREAGCKSLFMNKMYQNGKSTLSSKYSHLYFSFVFLFSKFSLMKIFYLYPQDDKDICYIKMYLT